MATTVLNAGSSLTDANRGDEWSSKCAERKHSESSGPGNTALDLASIAPLINAGFRAVLSEAAERGVLDPPHGRTPMPDPDKITQQDPFDSSADEDDDNDGEETNPARAAAVAAAATAAEAGSSSGGDGDGDDDDDDDDKLLEYKFDYGFNPLVFLGEYLRKNNPAAIQARKEQHRADLEYLRHRAVKCLLREAAVVELRELVAHRQSGIVHGPIVGDVSDCGGIIWARTFRPGQLTIELSRHEDFRTICRQAVTKVDHNMECSAIVEFDDLAPSTTWYHRGYLHNPRKGFDGPEAGFCVKGKFLTLPEGIEDSGGTFRLVAFSLHGLGLSGAGKEHRSAIEGACSAISSAQPGCCLALGEPSAPQGVPASSSMRRSCSGSFSDLQRIAARIPALSRLLQGNGFLTACGLIPKTLGKRHKGKHHQKNTKTPKQGSSSRLESGAVSTNPGGGPRKTAKPKRNGIDEEGGKLTGGSGDDNNAQLPPSWPIRCSEGWGSRSLGPTADLFLVDARAGLMGEDQLAWITEAVRESTRTWKLVACGVPVGFPMAPSLEQEQENEGTALQHAAAAKIQVHLRSRFLSRTSTTTVDKTTADKKHPGNGSGSSQRRPSGADVDGAGGNGIHGGFGPGKEVGGGVTDNSGTSRATVQMQGILSQLHASGCSNVVFVTPARSRPHALAFFRGHEEEGRFPVYELGCSGLAPLLLSIRDGGSGNDDTAPDAGAPGPCSELEPEILMPEIDASLLSGGGCDSTGGGVACTISFGREEGKDDWLSFVVSDAGGEQLASLTLPATR